MFIATFAAKSNRVQSCDVVKVIMEMKDGGELLLTFLTTAIICETIVCRSLNESVHFYEHLHGIELAKPAGEGELIEFDILIGLDFYWDIITGEVIRGISGPTAVYSRLGWILSGQTVTDSSSLMTHILTTGVRAIEDKYRLEEQLASFWELESLGILEHELTLYEGSATSRKCLRDYRIPELDTWIIRLLTGLPLDYHRITKPDKCWITKSTTRLL